MYTVPDTKAPARYVWPVRLLLIVVGFVAVYSGASLLSGPPQVIDEGAVPDITIRTYHYWVWWWTRFMISFTVLGVTLGIAVLLQQTQKVILILLAAFGVIAIGFLYFLFTTPMFVIP